MAFPTVRARQSSSRGSDATSHDIALGVTPNSGDLIVIAWATDGSGAANFSTSATRVDGTGSWAFTAGFADENHTAGCNGGIRYRVADGTEPSTLRFTTSASEHFCARAYVIQAGTFDSTTPITVTRGTEAATAAVVTPNCDPAGGAADFLWITGYAADDDDESTAAPTNYSNFVCIESAQSTTSCSLGIADRELNATSENPGDFTMAAAEEHIPWTLAIHPSSVTTVQLAGVLALAFGGAAVLSVRKPLAGTLSLTFGGAAALGKRVPLLGQITLSFGGAAVLTVGAPAVRLSGTLALAFAGTASLTVAGAAPSSTGRAGRRRPVLYSLATRTNAGSLRP